jgi:hypothetical protein
MDTTFHLENLHGRQHLADQGVEGQMTSLTEVRENIMTQDPRKTAPGRPGRRRTDNLINRGS